MLLVTADLRMSELTTSQLKTDVQKQAAHCFMCNKGMSDKTSDISCRSMISHGRGFRLALSQPSGIMKTIVEVKNLPSKLAYHLITKQCGINQRIFGFLDDFVVL